MDEENLVNIEGIGRATAKRIMEIISENVEFEEGEAEQETQDSQELDAAPKA